MRLKNTPADRTIIRADGNTAGKGLLDVVPELRVLHQRAISSALEYSDPRSSRTTEAIARHVAAPPETVLLTASTLREIERLPPIVGATDVVALKNDFPGYGRSALANHLPMWLADASPGNIGNPAEALANAVRPLARPIVFVTIGGTNPLQTLVEGWLEVARIKRANPNAIVVLDVAYIEYFGFEQADFTPLALENSGVIILAPASKILFQPGIASGWMVIGDKELRTALQARAFPYPMPGIGAALIPELLENDHVIRKARREVEMARDTLIGIGARGLEGMITGRGPWVLADFGALADKAVVWLADRGIRVQQQPGLETTLPSTWIRISATVEREARIIVAEIARFLASEGR